MEQDMRQQIQEILKEKKREKLQKKFYEQKESYDYYLEAKDQHQVRIAENKAKQHQEFVRNQDRLMQKVSDESAHIESWKAEQQQNNTLKQEQRLLKEADLRHLKLQQKRVNDKKLNEMITKRIQSDQQQALTQKT